MGNLFQTVMNRFTSSSKQSRIILIGLDGAGKTTLLFNMKLGEVVNTVPTIGFNMETVQYKNIEFNMWDVGGQDRLRALWHHYYEGADAIIYCVDSADRDRIDEASETLASVLSDETLKGA
jgi:ADP-ribosylation factor protein 1